MFSDITSFLDSFGIAKHIRRRGLSIFSRRGSMGRRSEQAGTSQGFMSLCGVEPLEVKKAFAVDIDLVGTVLTVAFDDTSADVLTLSINSTGYVATGANTSVGTGTITELVVIDAGTANTSSFTLLDASQTLTGGLSIGQNITSANLATAVDASGGNVTIHAASLTLGGNITSGPQVYSGNVTLTGDVTLTSTGSGVPDYTNLTLLASLGTGGDSTAYDVVLSQDGRYAFVSAYYEGLQVIDISDAANPVRVANLTGVNIEPGDLALSPDGNFIYVQNYGGNSDFLVLNVSDPTNPILQGATNATAGINFFGIALSPDGKTAYGTGSSFPPAPSFLELINVSNPASPTVFANVALPTGVSGVGNQIALSADGAYAFVSLGTAGVAIVDLVSRSVVGSLDTPGYADGITVSASGQYVYMTAGEGGLQVIDVSNLAQPTLVANTTAGPDEAVSLSPDGRYAFTGSDGYEMLIVDVTNPLSPAIVGNASPPPQASGIALSATENLLFVTTGYYQSLDVVSIGTIASPGSIAFLGSVDGPHSLTVNDGIDGTTLFGGEVGGTSPLTGLTTDANGTTTLGGSVTTSGNQTYGGVVNLTAATTLTGDTGAFAAGVTGNENDLTLNFAGTVAIAGGFSGIANLTSTGDATLCGNITTSCIQSYEADVELLCNTTLTSTGGSIDYVDGSIVGNLDTSGNACGVTLSADGQYAFIADGSSGLQIVDVSSVATPMLTGNLDTSGVARGVTLSADGRYAFIADGSSGLQIIDVSNVAAPALVGNLDTSGSAYGVSLSADGGYAFIADGSRGLQIINVSNVAAPTLAGNFDTSGSAKGVTLSADGRYAFIADASRGLQIIDVSNVATPTLAGNRDTSGVAYGVTLSADGGYAFIADGSSGLQIIDVSNVAAPTLTGNLDTTGLARGVTLSADGRYALIADGNSGLQVIDVSNVSAPALAGNIDTTGFARGVTLGADGTYSFIADSFAGLQIVEFPGPNPSAVLFGGAIDGDQALTVNANATTFSGEVGGATPLTGLTTDANGTTTLAANVTVAGSIDFGDDVTLAGDVTVTSTGSQSFDYANPVIAANVSTAGNVYAVEYSRVTPSPFFYVAQSEAGMAIYSIGTGLTGTYALPVADGYARNLEISADGNYAFLAVPGGTDNNLQIVDVSDPSSPFFVGGYAQNGTEAENLYDVTLSSDGTHAYLAYNTGDYPFQIVNVSNLANPTLVGSYNGPSSDYLTAVELSSDGRYAFVSSDSYGLLILDVSDPANISLAGRYTLGSTEDLALSADDSLAFLADGTSGLRVVNVSNVANPVLLGTLNTTGYAQSVATAADDRYLFLADGDEGLLVIDVANPANPLVYANLATASFALSTTSADPLVFVGEDQNAVQLVVIPEIISGGSIVFGGTVNGNHALTVNAAGETTFTGPVGGTTPLTSLTTDANGTTTLGGNVTTSGNQTYGDVVNLTAATTLTGLAGAFAGGAEGNDNDLTLNFTDSVAIAGGFSGIANLTSTGDATLCGNITTSGAQDYQGDVELVCDVILTSTGSSAGWVSNYADPTLVAQVLTGGPARQVVLSSDEQYAFIANADGAGGMTIADVSDPLNPSIVSTTITGNALQVAVSPDGQLAFVASIFPNTMQVFNVSDPSTPTQVANLSTGGSLFPYSVELSQNGSLAYLGLAGFPGTQQFRTYNVANASSPTLVGTANLTAAPYDIDLSADGRYAFVATDTAGLTVVNLAGGTPTIVSVTDTPGNALSVALSQDGMYAFIADDEAGVQIFDISNLASPALIGNVVTPGNASAVTLSADGEYLFVADVAGGLRVLDISNATAPVEIGSLDTPGDAIDSIPTADGKYVFVADALAGGLLTVALGSDLTTGSEITFGGTVNGNQALTVNANLTTFSGEVGGTTPLVSLTTDENGTTTLGGNVTTSGNQTYGDLVNLTAATTLTGATGAFAAGVTGNDNDLTLNFTDSVAIAGGFTGIANLTSTGDATLCGNITTSGAQDYQADVTLLCNTTLTSTGASVFVPDYANPTLVAQVLTGALARQVVLSSDEQYAFISIADAAGGMWIADVSEPLNPSIVSTTITGNAMQVAVSPDGQLAFVASIFPNTMQVFNVSDPSTPTQVANLSTGGSLFPFSVELSQNGSLAYLGLAGFPGTQQFRTYNVANASSPTLVGTANLTAAPYDIDLSADGRYAFVATDIAGLTVVNLAGGTPTIVSVTDTPGNALSVALSQDGMYAFIADNEAGVQIFDISNLASPALVGNVATPGTASAVTLSADGEYLFVADVAGGLRILDISNATAPVEIGSLDTPGDAIDSIPTADGKYVFVADAFAGGLLTVALGSEQVTPSEITFGRTVNGNHTLTVNANVTTFSGEVGGVAPLISLTTDANGTTTLAANVTVAGPVDFGDNVTLIGDVTVSSDDATFGGSVDGGYGLVVNSGPDGSTFFARPIGGTTPLASLTTNANGTTTLGGGSVTTTGNQSYGDTVRLIRNTTLVSGAGTITTAAVTDGPEGFGLTVGDANQTGAVVLGGNLSIGSVTAAAGAFDVSLTGANNSLETATFTNSGNLTLGSSASSNTFVAGGLTAPGVAKTFLAGSVVTDSGLITLNATSLTANAVLDSTNGGVSNGAAILLANGTELNGFRLETFGGQSDTELTGDTVVSDGELIVETGSLNLGTPSQAGTLTATQDTLIQVANGALNVYAGSTIAAGNNALTMEIDDLNVAAGAGNITAGSITVRPATVGRDIFLGSATGSGLVVNQNAFDSFQTPVITIGTAGYNGTVNAGNLAVPQGRLDIIANGTGGTVLFEGDFVSTATNLTGGIAVFVQGSGATTTLNGSITAAGDVVIDDAVVAEGSHGIDTSGTNANITITGGTTGIYGASGETNSLTINAGTGAVILGNQTGFGDNAGSGSLLENVTISAGSTRLGATTSEINGTFAVTSGTLLLAGNLAAGAVNVSSTAGLTLVGNATVTAVGNIAFAGTVDGPFALAVASNATTNFAAAVGDTTPLAALTLTGGTTRLGGDVTTTGNQSYATDLVLDGPTGLTGAFGSFNGDLDGNGNILVLDFANETAIGAGGSFTNLAELVSLGDVAINGTIATTGLQNYLGNVSLTGATTIAASDLGLATGVTGNKRDLTLDIAATMPINSSLAGIGNLTSLGNVALDGVITTTGFQNYAAAATLAADTTLNATGNIDFGSLVDGARQLTIQSGGTVRLFAALGSTTPLQGLNLASAAAVEALSTIAINGTGGTGAGLQIGNGVNNVNIALPGSTISNAALSGILLAGNTTGSTIGGFTITNSGSHGIEAAGGSYTGTTIENSSVTSSAGDGFHAANATGLTATLLRSAANSKAGIRVAGTSSNVTISDSLVGLDANGTAAQPNLGQGVVVSAATGTTLQGNTISGNGFYGVVVNGAAANTTISGNRIGIGTDGTTAIGNGQSGVFVLAGATGTSIVGNQIRNNNGMAGIQVVDGTSNTTIGGTAGDSNLLVGNGLFGITVSGNVPGTRILGNLVSSHTTANLYLNNAQNLTVGSATSGEENTFDTSDYGVYAGGDLSGTTIQGNTFQQHTLGGMVLTNAGNLTVRDNTVDDNGAYGIYGTGDLTGTTVQGNTISNQTVGVLVDNGANLTIGSGGINGGTTTSDPDANVITKNTSAGIVVNGAGSQNVSILSNSIFENDFIGISLSAGGNALARTPTLATASTTQVTGSISGTNGDVFRIQYFKSADEVTSSSRFAQGQELIGYQDVTIAGGTASINFDLTGSGVIVTDWITATATLLVGGLPSETSQFSFGIRVTA